MSERAAYARFVGDPTGYLIRGDDVPAPDERPTGWVVAGLGKTDMLVRINLDLAYLIEECEPEMSPEQRADYIRHLSEPFPPETVERWKRGKPDAEPDA